MIGRAAAMPDQDAMRGHTETLQYRLLLIAKLAQIGVSSDRRAGLVRSQRRGSQNISLVVRDAVGTRANFDHSSLDSGVADSGCQLANQHCGDGLHDRTEARAEMPIRQPAIVLLVESRRADD